MSTIESFIKEKIALESNEAFYVFNVEDVIRKHQKWPNLLPRVVPYYAVKVNPFSLILDLMVGLGLHFDCASQYEIETLIKIGAKPEDIVYAHPNKLIKSIQYSKSVGVDLMTFDNCEELEKINSMYPSARLVLRIKVDDKHSFYKLGLKFGVDINNVENVLLKAKQLGMNVIGVAFHVGSGCQSAQTFADAIQTARIAFDIGLKLKFKMTLLDIGGGYPGSDVIYYKKIGDKIATFEQMSIIINDSLNKYFPEEHLTIIAEPGRYYNESAFCLVTQIISKTSDKLENGQGEYLHKYTLDQGIYSALPYINDKTYIPIPVLESTELMSRSIYPSILWGPTCDSGDCIRKDILMPDMNVGEWILFEDMGAYPIPYGGVSRQYGFNGMPSPRYEVYVSEFAENYLSKINCLSNSLRILLNNNV